MPTTTPEQSRDQLEWGDLARTLLLLDDPGATRRLANAGIMPVLTRGSAAAPGTGSEGDLHLLSSGALVYRTAAGAWQTFTPTSACRWQVSVTSEAGRVYQWTGAAWSPIDSTAAAAAAAAQATADAALPASELDYVHTQASASSTWTINHNLGRRPAITLYTTGGVQFSAEITHTSVNQAVVSLALAIAGTARCL